MHVAQALISSWVFQPPGVNNIQLLSEISLRCGKRKSSICCCNLTLFITYTRQWIYYWKWGFTTNKNPLFLWISMKTAPELYSNVRLKIWLFDLHRWIRFECPIKRYFLHRMYHESSEILQCVHFHCNFHYTFVKIEIFTMRNHAEPFVLWTEYTMYALFKT